MFNLFNKKFHDSETKIADMITRFAGSMSFVYIHIAWFAFWLLFAHQIGDPFPFGLLTLIVSLEAIFLSTFILVSQNRQAQLAEERDKEDEEDTEEIQEDIEDIQEDFDTLQKDLAEVRKLIERIEAKTYQAETANKPVTFQIRPKKKR